MRLYEELEGAFGDQIVFRPERQQVKDLLSRESRPQITVGEESYRLIEVGADSLTLEAPNFTAEQDALVGVEIRLHEEVIFEGKARVSSLSTNRVELELQGFIDLTDLAHRDGSTKFTRDLQGGVQTLRSVIPPDFLSAIDSAAAFYQYYKRSLSRHEARLRMSGREHLLPTVREEAYEAIWPHWVQMEQVATDAARGISDRKILKAAKEYAETVLTPHIMGVPILQRSYTKPLGYPGDYQAMLYCYGNSYEGQTLYDQVFHKIAVDHPLSAGIRTRKDFIVQQMAKEHHLAISQARNFNATSLGCGPALEVTEHIKAMGKWPGSATWTLIDQERKTLEVAYTNNKKELLKNHANGHLNCYNLAFNQLLSDVTVLKGQPLQDFVYCVGLFDYLSKKKAQLLVKTFYDLLRPGGTMAVGNAIGPNSHLFTPEFVLDWSLIYRTKEDMRQFVALLPSNAAVDIETESSNAYYFLMVRKPA